MLHDLTSKPASPADWLRRMALFLSMLISGGLALFPRDPLVLTVIVLCLAATGLRLPRWRSIWPLLALLAAVLFVTLARPGPLSLASLVSRYAHYLAALLMVHMYLRAPEGALNRDLLVLLRPMAWQAILTVLLAHTLTFLFLPLVIGEQHYRSFLLLFTYHITIEEAGGLIRPDGFFFEPGVFQIYLNLYLYLALFVLHKPRQTALAVLAVLSTQSTTGMLICLILLGTALLQRLNRGSFGRKAATALMALALAPPLLVMGYDNISDKLFGVSQGSSWARQYDLVTGLNIVAENPWMGIGLDVERYLNASSLHGFEGTLLTAAQLRERPTSNGLVQLFYSMGIPLALPFLLGIFRQRFFRHRWLIGIWITLSLLGEALLFTPFFLFIVFSAFVVKKRPRPRSLPPSLKGATT